MKCKQLLSVILMLCMIASSLVTFAAPVYDAKYECSPVSFGYEDGEVWTDAVTLEGGKAISAKVTAKTTGEKENMVFSIFVYDDGKMVDCEIVTKEVTSEGADFKVSADVPADTEGCHVVAMLWNNFYDMDMICDSAIYPSSSTKLRSLYIDGVAVKGFDPDVTEYTYAIEPDAESYPEITWEATDSSAKVTLIAPKSFPGISTVSVEAADGQKTEYRIKYESTLGDIVSNIEGAGTAITYIKGGMVVGGPAYNDRPQYSVTAIGDSAYEGADMIQASIAWQSDATFKGATTVDWITFDVSRGVTVKVLKSDNGATEHFIEEGYTLETTDLETGFVQTTTNTVKNHKVAMSKHFNAGQKVKIPNGKSSTTYLVAIIHDPIGYVPEDGDGEEPEEPVDESLMLSSLSVDGVDVADFDSAITEYDLVLTPGQLQAENAPEVTYTLADQTSTAVVTTPNSFPGSAVVTVTNVQNQSVEYVINYDARNIVTDITPDAEVTKAAAFVYGGVKLGGHVASDRMESTSWKISEIVPTIEGQSAILTPVDGWVDVVNNFTFNLNRKANITVLQNSSNKLAVYTDIGFTADSDVSSTRIKIVNHAGTDFRTYIYVASKEYEAGEITLPYTKPNMPTLTALEFAPWANASAPDVSLNLESISIDGVAIADFEDDIATYEVALTDAQMAAKDAPEVTYTLADNTSSAVMEGPTSFPGNVKITVTNAETETKTYTVKYTAEVVKDLALNDAAGDSAPQPEFVENLSIGDRTYADRTTNFLVTSIDESIVGKARILYALGWKNDGETQYHTAFTGEVIDWVTFTAARDMTVSVYEASSKDSDYAGFTKETSTTPYMVAHAASNGDLNYTVKYSKTYSAGDTVALPNCDASNRIGMVVIDSTNWGEEQGGEEPDTPVVPDEPELDSLALTEIKIDGAELEGFDSDETTFTHNLTVAQMAATDAPVVTYTLADSSSSAVVTNPTEFPGKALITVTDAQSGTRTYTINYEATDIIKNFSTDASVEKSAVHVPGGIKIGGRVASDRMDATQWAINILDVSFDGQDAILTPVDGWKDVVSTFSFDLGRDAIITVIQNRTGYLTPYTDLGFTADEDVTTVKVRIGNNNGAGQEGNNVRLYQWTASKEFEAGSVTLPYTKPNMPVLTAVKYAPWGGFPESGEPENPEVPEESGAEIMSIKDGKESIVVIVSDDGIYDTAVYLNDILGANNLKASIGLIAGRIDETAAIKWQKLFDDGVLNAESHSMTHTYMGQDNTKAESAMVNGEQMDIPVGKMETEIAGSQAKIRELFPDQKALVYIRPGVGTITDMDGNPLTSTSEMAMEMMKDTYIAARVTGRTAYTKQGVDTIPPTDYYGMYSIMPGNTTTAEDIMASVDEAVENNGILVFCFHGIDEAGSSELTTRKSETDIVFNTLGEYAAEGKVWVPFYDEAVKYMKETESAEVSVEENGDAIELTVTDNLDNAIYNYPITIKTEVPSDWAKAMLTQGERAELVESFTEGGKTYVYANVIPDGGVATLEKTTRTGNYATLSDIKLDGESIADFASDKFNYTVDVDPADLTYPVVTFTVNDGAEAEVTNPVSYPGEATITVTENGKENVYKITYTVSELLEDLKAADSTVDQPKYVSGGMAVGALAYVDRPQYDIDAINDERFVGYDTILTGIGWQSNATFKSSTYTPWITFKTNRKVEVTILKTNNTGNANLIADGYTLETSDHANGFVYVYTNADKNYMYAYTKTYAAGETVSIPNAMTNITYLVALKFPGWSDGEEDPEVPDEPEVPAVATVKSISLDGVALQNFDAETLEYNVTLTDTQLASDTYPEVTYELNDTEATAVVTNPVSFPGFAEVKVTDSQGEKTYKINYLVPDIEINMSSLAPEDTPLPVIVESMTIGTPAFVGRTTFPIEAINDNDVEGALWMKQAIGWKNDTADYRDVYMGNQIEDWVNFEAKRGMVVTLYEDVTSNGHRFNYWTTETSTETPYIVGTAATPLKYIAKHQRYFAPGETVKLPNVYGSRVPTVTIKYLGWGEEAPELDVTIPVVRQISYSDLVPKVTSGEGVNVTEGQWSGVTDVNTTKYQLSKEFANITEPTEISITTDKIDKGYGIIVVAPLDSEATDKNVIVNADGSELQWTDDTQVVADYAYTNGGDEDFDADNATFGRYNAEAVTFSGGTAYVYEKMHNSDDMYITGSRLGWNRNPYIGELHWTGLPDDYIGCNYIVVDFNTGFNGGERTFTFTVDQPVKIWVHSKASAMTVTDTVSEDEWTASQYAVRRRYQNVLDHLSCAYMLKKGYINQSNIAFDGKVGDTNGVRFNRYDVYEKLIEDCGTDLGWAIDPEKVEATGFTNSINTYRYEEYLEAWVD